MSKKAKKPQRPTRTDLHAISPLPVEFIQERLLLLQKRGLQVDIAPLGQDDIAFQLKHPKMRAVATGTLRRWEGTKTRIDANTTPHMPPIWVEWVVQLGLMAFLTLFLLGCSLGVGMISIFSFLGSVAFATVLSLLVPVSKFFERFRLRALKDADRQLNLLVYVLTQNLPQETGRFIEFDGSDQSLERMVQRSQQQAQQ